jgi:hypothetical protein
MRFSCTPAGVQAVVEENAVPLSGVHMKGFRNPVVRVFDATHRLIWSDLSSLALRVFVRCSSPTCSSLLVYLFERMLVQQCSRPRNGGDDDHSDIRGFSHENDPSGAASVYCA